MDASTLQGSLKPVGSLKRFVKIRRFLGPLNLPVISNSGPEQDKTALSSSRGIQKRLDQRCTGQASWAVDAHNYVIPDLMFVLEFGERVMEPLSLGHRRGGSGILHSASMCSICEPVIPSEVSARIFGMDSSCSDSNGAMRSISLRPVPAVARRRVWRAAPVLPMKTSRAPAHRGSP